MHYTKKQRRLIALTHQIIDGIPPRKIYLDMFRANQGKSLSCGTICCGGGWISLHPVFVKLGLTMNEAGIPVYKGKEGNEAMNALFGWNAFDEMFGMSGLGDNDQFIYARFGDKISDKTLLLHRLKIAYHGFEKWENKQWPTK